MLKRIDITEIEGFRLGNAEDKRRGTGCTVIISEEGATAGVDVRGSAPATRETDLLKSENSIQKINAVLISGGSAYGLEAGSGVANELERKNIGYKIGEICVPIICQASLFDLWVGRDDIRPDKLMGMKCVENAYLGKFSHGNYGAGTGASVGKLFGIERAMKTGLGTYACQIDELQIGAVTAVNALADVYDVNGKIVAGMLDDDGWTIMGSITVLKENVLPDKNDEEKLDDDAESLNHHTDTEDVNLSEGSEETKEAKEESLDKEDEREEINESIFDKIDLPFNTTISCLITNAKLTKAECNKLASILHDGFARAIKPVHTSMDGDTIFVMTTGAVDVNFDAFAALSTDIVQYSIIDSALSAEDAYNLKSASHFIKDEMMR